MEVVFLVGIVIVAALAVYLLAVGARADRSSRIRRRGKALGVLYLVAGIVPAALGLGLVLDTAFGGEDTSEPLDGSFAAGLFSDFDDEIWYATGGWLLLGGGVVAVGAWCGRRGLPLARAILAFGLLLLGIPGLLAGVGVIYLLLVPILLLWGHEREPSADS
jgi:ABC-type Fe3+ transport system permease subunit